VASWCPASGVRNSTDAIHPPLFQIEEPSISHSPLVLDTTEIMRWRLSADVGATRPQPSTHSGKNLYLPAERAARDEPLKWRRGSL
jgi:hypothetical protein